MSVLTERMTDRQLDGYACVVCGAEPSRMVPVGFGTRGQLFECADAHQPVDPFDTEARAICEAKAQWWDDLRAFNRAEHKTGVMADKLMTRSTELDQRVEQLRRKHFPRAYRLIVSDGEAITVSKTGRSTKRVWTTP